MAETGTDTPNGTIPVTLEDGNTWRSKRPPLELCTMLYGLASRGQHILAETVVEKLYLDHASRTAAGNPISIDMRPRQLTALRRNNKGLAMEMTMSAVLTHVDHPEQVLMNCTLDEETGLPHRFAGPVCPTSWSQPPPRAGEAFGSSARSARTSPGIPWSTGDSSPGGSIGQ